MRPVEVMERSVVIVCCSGHGSGNDRLDTSGEIFQDLAGVGVTFKLVWALSQRLSRAKKVSNQFREFLMDSLALVALALALVVVYELIPASIYSAESDHLQK